MQQFPIVNLLYLTRTNLEFLLTNNYLDYCDGLVICVVKLDTELYVPLRKSVDLGEVEGAWIIICCKARV